MKPLTIIKTILLLLLFRQNVFSQAPAFNIYIVNECYPTSKTFQFDIWIKKTGSGVLSISNLQFGININNALRSTATITPSIVSGSSMFNTYVKPDNVNYANNVSSGIDRIDIVGKFASGCTYGVVIPDTGTQCTAQGIRIATIQLSTSNSDWPLGVTPNLDINLTSGSVLKTKISYYPQPCSSYSTDATGQCTFYDYNTSGTCTQNPSSPGCTQLTSTTVSSISSPTCAANANGSFTVSNTFPTATNGNIRYTIDGGNVTVTTVSNTNGSRNRSFTGLGRGAHLVQIERGTNLTTGGGGTVLCTGSVYVILLGPTDTITATAAYDSILCNGGSTELIISGTGGSGVYKYAGGATFSNSSYDVKYVTAGSYSFSISDNNNCPSFLLGLLITEPPALVLDSGLATDASYSTCDDGTITAWASGGTGLLTYYIYGATNSYSDYNNSGYFTGLTPDDYYIGVFDDCTSASEQIVTVSCPSPRVISQIVNHDSQDLTSGLKLKAFPNPTSGLLNVSFQTNLKEKFILKILDPIGNTLSSYSGISEEGLNSHEFDLRELAKSIYMLELFMDKRESKSIKISVQ